MRGAPVWDGRLRGLMGALLVVTGATGATAEPFLLVPRLPTELAPGGGPELAAPGGWELTRGGSSTGAGAVVGPVGTGIRGAVMAGVAGASPARVQLTLSTFGTDFYREHRAAAAVVVGGAEAVGVVVDGRMAVLGPRRRTGVGVGWLLRARWGPLGLLATARPSARQGEASLFPEGWSARVGLLGRTGALGVSASGGVEGSPAVGVIARWVTPTAVLDLGLDLATGALTVGVGLRGGPLVGFAAVRHHEGLGTGGRFGVLGGGG